MDIIDFQTKAKPQTGFIETYWFENENIGLIKTLFHRIVIPFEPFDSGLEYVTQPESTELLVEWAKLDLEDPSELDGIDLSKDASEGLEASIYLGGAHNWTRLKQFSLTKVQEVFSVHCLATVEFENEGVGQNETIQFETTVVYRGGG
jgi:hypothetical protein